MSTITDAYCMKLISKRNDISHFVICYSKAEVCLRNNFSTFTSPGVRFMYASLLKLHWGLGMLSL